MPAATPGPCWIERANAAFRFVEVNGGGTCASPSRGPWAARPAMNSRSRFVASIIDWSIARVMKLPGGRKLASIPSMRPANSGAPASTRPGRFSRTRKRRRLPSTVPRNQRTLRAPRVHCHGDHAHRFRGRISFFTPRHRPPLAKIVGALRFASSIPTWTRCCSTRPGRHSQRHRGYHHHDSIVTKGSAPAPSRKCDNFEAGVHQTTSGADNASANPMGHDDHWRYCSHKSVSWKAMQRHRS